MTVSLVGAGPGDPGLITRRGFELLKSAQVVVVDALVSRELLKETRGQIISVGKRGPGAPTGASHEFAQEKINQLLVRLGKTGKRVVRLKGGDPFLFGRGSEELEALRRANIPYEVVPGLSSATAVPAAAGIPITDRRYASQVTVLTGHEGKKKNQKSPGVDWKSISPKGTLVILMGVSEWPRIVSRLLARKWKQNAPVAAIQSGTTPDERILESTLGESIRYFQKQKLMAPAIVVVGEVVRLRKKRVVVTRPLDQSAGIIGMLHDAGFEPVIFPTIEVRPLSKKVSGSHHDWLLFLSVNAVRTFSAATKIRSWPVVAIGPETKKVAKEWGWNVKRVPKKFTSQGVLAALGNVKGKSILLPRVQNAPKDLVIAMKRHGAHVDEVVTYKVTFPKASASSREKVLKGVDAVTFTSASTVKGFCKNFSRAERAAIFTRAKAYSIGPQTSAALRKYGIGNIYEAKQSTTQELVRSITF